VRSLFPTLHLRRVQCLDEALEVSVRIMMSIPREDLVVCYPLRVAPTLSVAMFL
jgi:hypothetical protein